MKGKMLIALMIGWIAIGCASTSSNIFDTVQNSGPEDIHQRDEAAAAITSSSFMGIILAQELEPKEVYGNLTRIKDLDTGLIRPMSATALHFLRLAQYDEKDPLSVCTHGMFAEFEWTCMFGKGNKNLDAYCKYCMGEQRKRCTSHGMDKLFDHSLLRAMRSSELVRDGISEYIESTGLRDKKGLTMKDTIKSYMETQLKPIVRNHLMNTCVSFFDMIEENMATIYGKKMELDYAAMLEKANPDHKLYWERCSAIKDIYLESSSKAKLAAQSKPAGLSGQICGSVSRVTRVGWLMMSPVSFRLSCSYQVGTDN